jgi:hypothetical protein
MKYYLLILTFVICRLGNAQVVISPQLPTLGIYTKGQLWSLALTNTTNEQPQVKLELLFSDNATGQAIFSAVTNTFYLNKGVKQVQLGELSPISYTVLSNSYGVDASPNGFLPVGVFSICYKVLKVNNDSYEQLAEDCEIVEVEPTSPPVLVQPYDEEQVESDHPLFTWIPPMPVNLFNNLSYDLKLVEVGPTQSAADAVQQNLPLYQKSNILITSEPYPSGYAALDTGKKYAWQITAKSNGLQIAKSEMWIFSVKAHSMEPMILSEGAFAKLRKIEDPAFIICNGTLRYEYINERNENQVQIRLYDVTGTTRKEMQLDSSLYPVKFGSNYMQLNVEESTNVANNHFYLLEATSPASNEKYYLRFQYKQPQ